MKLMRWVLVTGARTDTLVALSAVAVPLPNSSSMASTTRETVWKLGWRTLSITSGRWAKSLGIIRSTVAPLGIKPLLEVLIATREPLAPSALTPPMITAPWDKA